MIPILKTTNIYLFLALFASYSFAKTSLSSSELQRLEQLDGTQQQRQIQYQQAQQAQQQSASDVRFNTPHQVLSLPQQDLPCYPIKHIKLIDYSPFNALTENRFFLWALTQSMNDLALTLPYCLGTEGLRILMNQIQNKIIEAGYVTTRIAVQEQNLQSGHLVLTLILGKIGKIIIEDNSRTPRFTRLQSLTALTFRQGNLLNLRDIEQTLENLKRVPTADANIEILPSQEPHSFGVSDIKIVYKQRVPFRLSLNLDDSGSRSTGKYQGSATLAIDNLFSANDLFYTSFTHRLKTNEDDKGRRSNKNLAFYYSIPFRYWTFSFFQSTHDYYQEIFRGTHKPLLYSGHSNTSQVELAYLIYRDAVRKTTLSGNIWSLQSNNTINHAEIYSQKRRMAGWEMGIHYKEYHQNTTLNASIHFKRGTGARKALPAPEESRNEGTSRAKIITTSVSLLTPFTLGSHIWQWQSHWQMQWNQTPLVPQQRFTIGGRYTVRGFDGELSLSGNRGWLWRNELAWNVYQQAHWLYIGLDAGQVAKRLPDQLGNRLIGSVFGFKGNQQGLYYDVFMGKPIYKPNGFRTANTLVGFQFGVLF